MFEPGGYYAPYDAGSESGEISTDDEEEEQEKKVVVHSQPTSSRHTYTAVLFMRTREIVTRNKTLTWFEFLMEKQKNMYQFPQRVGPNAVQDILESLKQRRLLSIDSVDRYLETRVESGRTSLTVYKLPLERTQRARRDRELAGAPKLFWICESELATHDQVGPPSAFGVPIAPWALSVLSALPIRLRFASPTPPLVLYHGTETRFKHDILRLGLKPSVQSDAAMLGRGVYFARWDKALDFARHDAYNVLRSTPGIVLRCIVDTGRTIEMTSTAICTCGCGKPYVDHLSDHSRGYQTVFVPDNALGATRRAEWCVKDPDLIHLEGVFTV